MKLSKEAFITKIHLVISVIIVIPVSFIYGFNPSSQFDIFLNTVDENNFFKAIMGLYIGFSILWIFGIFKTKFLKSALLSNMIFMLGLGFGRLLSIFIDCTPTFGYTFGTAAELFLGFYGFWVINNKKVFLQKK